MPTAALGNLQACTGNKRLEKKSYCNTPDTDTDEDDIPDTPNADQADWDEDGIGDTCDDPIPGDMDGNFKLELEDALIALEICVGLGADLPEDARTAADTDQNYKLAKYATLHLGAFV